MRSFATRFTDGVEKVGLFACSRSAWLERFGAHSFIPIANSSKKRPAPSSCGAGEDRSGVKSISAPCHSRRRRTRVRAQAKTLSRTQPFTLAENRLDWRNLERKEMGVFARRRLVLPALVFREFRFGGT